jgi:hypothetical protein
VESNITAGVWLGSVGATTGTFSRALPTATEVYTSIVRSRYANVNYFKPSFRV